MMKTKKTTTLPGHLPYLPLANHLTVTSRGDGRVKTLLHGHTSVQTIDSFVYMYIPKYAHAYLFA